MNPNHTAVGGQDEHDNNFIPSDFFFHGTGFLLTAWKGLNRLNTKLTSQQDCQWVQPAEKISFLQTPCHLDSVRQAGLMNSCLQHCNTWHCALHQELAGLCNYILSSQIRHDTVFMLTLRRWMIPDPAQNLPGYKILKPIWTSKEWACTGSAFLTMQLHWLLV